MTVQTENPKTGFQNRLQAEGMHPALAAEAAIRLAIDAARVNDAERVHLEVEYAKYAILSRRCGMEERGCDLMSIMRSPGLALCSGLSNVSEKAQEGRLDGVISILAEAAMRAHALAS